MDPKKRQDIQNNLPAESLVLDQLRYNREFTDIHGNKVEFPSNTAFYHIAPDDWEKERLPNQACVLESHPLGVEYGFDLITAEKNPTDKSLINEKLSFDVKNRQNPHQQDLYFELHRDDNGIFSFGYNKCQYIVFVFLDNRVVYVPTKSVLRLANTGYLDRFCVKKIGNQYHYAIPEADFINDYQHGYTDCKYDYLRNLEHKDNYEDPEDYITIYYGPTLSEPVSTTEGDKLLTRTGFFFSGDPLALQFLDLDGFLKPKDFNAG